ncbi:MAG: hypothetical protein GC191_11020 [Azospirillum sp.]|nr:hypothetical protein [Azospirillum sp.]
MADPSSFLPLPPNLTGTGVAASAQTAGQPLGEVDLLQLPERLQSLARAIVLTGTIAGATADGSALRVRTQAGEVLVRLTNDLPADGPLTLRIAPGTPPARAYAFAPGDTAAAVAGPARGPATAATAQLPAPLLLALTTPEPGAATPLEPQSLLTALVLGRGGLRPEAAVQTPGGAAALAPGDRLVLRLLSLASGDTASTPANPTARGVAATATTSPAPATAEAALAGPSATLLTGIVTGHTAAGEPVVETPGGLVALAVRTLLAPGTRISAAIVDPAELLAARARADDPAPWPALRDALATLASIDRTAAQSVIDTVMPRPNGMLASALVFFLGAARRSDGRGWLGEDNVAKLEEAGRGDLLSRLDHEVRGASRRAVEPQVGEWRAYSLPFLDGQAMTRLDCYVHQIGEDETGADDGDGDGTRRRRGGSRFVIELSLSQFGALQLDGLVHRDRFNLILRSRQPLGPALRQELSAAFADSLAATGLAGGLAFATGERGWIKPVPAPAGGRGGVLA